nr:MAG TPA: minor capsid protein [Caudoviricetes sp.]
MESVNDLLLAESIRHQVDLQGYSGGVLSRLLAVLNRSDARLRAELLAKLESMDATTFSMERLESLLTSVRSMSAATYQELGYELNKELSEFVAYEVSYQQQMLVQHLPIGVHVAAVSAEQVYAAALARPFQGVLLKNVWSDLDAAKMKRVRQTIAQGYVEGKTTDQIIRELYGTRAKGYADGFIERDRRDVEAVVRTAIGHTAGFAQDRVMEANADLIKAVQWSATLDLRTSSQCRIRDRKLYTPDTHKPIGHSIPWGAGPSRLHWRCRSGQVPVLKSFKELGIDIPEIEVGGKTRASMDGQLPADTSYADWIKKQSAARQDEVLGPTRARLLRDGKLGMADLYSARGELLTLDDLRKRDAEAFKRAGL